MSHMLAPFVKGWIGQLAPVNPRIVRLHAFLLLQFLQRCLRRLRPCDDSLKDAKLVADGVVNRPDSGRRLGVTIPADWHSIEICAATGTFHVRIPLPRDGRKSN